MTMIRSLQERKEGGALEVTTATGRTQVREKKAGPHKPRAGPGPEKSPRKPPAPEQEGRQSVGQKKCNSIILKVKVETVVLDLSAIFSPWRREGRTCDPPREEFSHLPGFGAKVNLKDLRFFIPGTKFSSLTHVKVSVRLSVVAEENADPLTTGTDVALSGFVSHKKVRDRDEHPRLSGDGRGAGGGRGGGRGDEARGGKRLTEDDSWELDIRILGNLHTTDKREILDTAPNPLPATEMAKNNDLAPPGCTCDWSSHMHSYAKIYKMPAVLGEKTRMETED
ncbi:hypothetical protein EYF80_046131 [Liparis tanakae]|uniref:Uncharacterized protein n=1 Tax=Liparis tanakae TaxID=230148 RepID=A0A4Z2FRA4_9TELE|nr:hypothetical protein EYF80_046131 [Liparis tanakae]